MITKNTILTILIITFLISSIATFLIPSTSFKNSKFNQLLKIFSSLSIIFIGLGLVLTSEAIETAQDSQELTKIQQTYALIDRALMNPIDKMNKLYDKCPNFIRSLWPQKNLFNDQLPESSNNKDNDIAVLDLSMTLLQSFEDHYTGNKLDQTGEVVWAGNYLQWANSPKFYEMWKILYPNFKSSTNDYAKLLFSYSQGVQILDGDKLLKLSYEFANDKNLIKIVESAS
jgi:hypothetical protein